MLRDQHADTKDLIRVGRDLRELCTTHDTLFLVNRRVDVALLTRADGVHLPASGMTVAQARQLLGPTATIGASAHDQAELARAEDADYVSLSPFADTPGKGPPMERAKWSALCAKAGPPVIALGGICADNTGAAMEAGAYGIACIRAAFDGDGPRRLVDSLSAVLDSRRPAKG